ncbi:MAG TPA: Calx-beta domain-containing protein [Pyrinomonadaceae bacterium]|nr:Calx-beta domain-containing protein [Pyrinomonadaceae bacterium]
MLKTTLIALLSILLFTSDHALAATLPGGFVETQISGGLSNTTAIGLHPDGRIFVCQQTGELRVIKNGAVLPTPFLTLTVNSFGERGLLGVAFDPDYATNRFVYVYYTAQTPTIHNRVSRFTADAANEDVAVAGSEVAILDLETLGASNHNGGAIHFGPDGKLYIATGENAVTSNSQSLANRLGKILRINSDGSIPDDNPTSFANITGSPAGVNRAIWAVGLRNPFTFSFQPGTGLMHINDVGQGTWEEVNTGIAGANYGWPTCEGTCATGGMTNPLYQYSSAVAAPCAITGGAFYNPTTPTFPAEFIGKYFFADFCAGWIKTLDPLSPPLPGAAVDFATAINSPVDIQVANDGSLYYLARGNSSVYRVQFIGGATLAVNDLNITEGASGTSVANFTVSLSGASSDTVTVNYATANDTAVAGSDYVAANGTLTFTPGQQSQTVSVTINGDATFEPTESFFVNLTNPVNATLSDSQGVGTITNDDFRPRISIDDASVSEGNSGTTTAGFIVSLTNPSSQTITVNFATAPGTATAGSDYVSATGTVTFTPGQTSRPINITVNGDTVSEANETFFVDIATATNATISDTQGTGTINNDDGQPAISINNVLVSEGNAGTTTAMFTVSLSNASSQTITVNFATAAGTATAGTDYVSASGTVTFTAGQTSQPINVTVNGDTTFEPNETFSVNLSSSVGATIADSQGSGTINNDDAAPTISINDVSVSEGNSGTTTAGFTVSLSNASSQTITVNFATVNGTATAGSDYASTSSVVTFTPGQTSQPININITGDTTFEPNETFSINLANATNATISDNQGAGTITNDDTLPVITINDVSLSEGNAGTKTATFTVSLSNASSQTITVNFATSPGTATAGNDYVSSSGTVTFAPGQTSRPVNVTINGDTLSEPNETFTVNLSSPVNSTISDSQGTGTITNDDAQPTLSINDVSITEGNSGTVTAAFTVSLSTASGQTVTVNHTTSGGSATAGTDYVLSSGTLTFTPGQLTQPINVTVNGDTMLEANETFNIVLSGATNATIADSQGVGTINNDDSQPTISINDLSLNEGDSGTTNAAFTVSLSNASNQTITVNYATVNNTATAGDDYTSASGTITFTPGQTSQSLNVGINGDELNEDTVSFNVNLTAPTNATITDSQAVGTIVDDDAPVLATELNSQRAVALDTVVSIRDPFPLTNEHYFGADKHTRVSLFATNIELKQGLVITAQAIDPQQTTHQLQVEFVSALPTFPGFTQIVVKLPDGIMTAGDLQITITVRGKTSNVVLLGVKP